MLKNLLSLSVLVAILLTTHFTSAQTEPSFFDSDNSLFRNAENSVVLSGNSGSAFYRLDSLYYEEIDPNDNTNWLPDLYYLYEYNDANNLSRQTISSWDAEADSWVYFSEAVYSYDENNFCNLIEDFQLDIQTGEFLPYSTTSYNVSEAGVFTEIQRNNYDEDLEEMIPYYRWTYTLNEDGLQQDALRENWSVQDQVWKSSTWYQYTINALGQRIETNSFYYDLVTEDWVANRRFEFSFDESGNLVDRTTTNINGVIETPGTFIQYNFDENSTLVSFENFSWDEESADWEPTNQQVYHHDHTVAGTDLQLPWFDLNEEEFNRKLDLVDRYAYVDGNVQLVRKIHHFYQDITEASGVSERQLNVVVYPNPASDKIVFELPEKLDEVSIELYDATASLIIRKQLPLNNSLDLTTLVQGTYFYKIISEDQFASGQFSVIK